MLWKVKFQELKDKVSGFTGKLKQQFAKKDDKANTAAKPQINAAKNNGAVQSVSGKVPPKPPVLITPKTQEEESVLSAIPQDDIYSSQPEPQKEEPLKIREGVADKENPGAHDFLKPLCANPDNDNIPLKRLGTDKPEIIKRKRKSSFSFSFTQIIADLFNGLIVAACAVACGLLLANSYLIKPAPFFAWLAFIPFTLAIFNIRSGFFSFIFGWLTGGIFYFVMLNWVSLTVFENTADPALANTSLIALSAVLSLQFAFFALGSFYAKRMPAFWPLATACLWVGLEVLHQLIALKFVAFPWFVLGYTQYNLTYLIQISTFTGAYGVSFIVILTSVVGGLLFTQVSQMIKGFYFVLSLCVLLFAFSFGYKTIKDQLNYLQSSPTTLRIALMQPYTHKLYVEGRSEDVAYTIADQMEKLKDKKVSFVIWPESSLPGDLTENEYMEFVTEQNNRLKLSQLFGGNESANGNLYVGAVLTDETGIADDYKKTQLVPYGEFLPFKGLLGWYYDKHNVQTLTGNYQPGTNPGKVFTLTTTQTDSKAASKETPKEPEEFIFGTEICFESIFPSIYRQQALNGADFFVNISNDGWFGQSAAPYQHLRANVFRAVENRRPLLRSTNTGISAWINSLGKIKFSTNLDKQESSVFNFVFKDRDQKTFYTKHGDIFAYVCLLLALTAIIVSLVFGENESGYGD